jgi:hypothetical protein
MQLQDVEKLIRNGESETVKMETLGDEAIIEGGV